MEHLKDGVGVFGVEVSGGLVGEDDGGPVDEGAGDGDTLLLATGELLSAVIRRPWMPSISVRWSRRGLSSSVLLDRPRLAMSWEISMLPMAKRAWKAG